MTKFLFTGCTLISFGPIFSLFLLFICRNPIRQVLFFVGCFLSLLTVVAGSLLWFLFTVISDKVAFTMPISVLLMEAGRYLCYQIVTALTKSFGATLSDPDLLPENRHKLSLVFGIGYGFVSGFITMPVILQQLLGPGNFGLQSQSQYFAVCSSVLCMCFTLMHCMWNVLLFEAVRLRSLPRVGLVVLLHFAASAFTLCNNKELYVVSVPGVIIVLIVSVGWTAYVCGMSKDSLFNSITTLTTSTNDTSSPFPSGVAPLGANTTAVISDSPPLLANGGRNTTRYSGNSPINSPNPIS